MSNSKQQYLTLLGNKLEAYYIKVRDYDINDSELSKGLESYMEAGLVLQGVTKVELETVITEKHQKIFRASLTERRKQADLSAFERREFDHFEIPAWKRKNP